MIVTIEGPPERYIYYPSNQPSYHNNLAIAYNGTSYQISSMSRLVHMDFIFFDERSCRAASD